MLQGILSGVPLSHDDILRHVVDADVPPPLPPVVEPAAASPVRLVSIRFEEGCYGLNPGERLEFGPRLTLVYGENGCGKSSVARLLRAAVGRPSVPRPPRHSFTGVVAEAVLEFDRGSGVEEVTWRAGERVEGLHVEVFDSADTRVDGIEFQVRPRAVLTLEELRVALDDLRVAVGPLVVPTVLRGALDAADLRELEDPISGPAVLEAWRSADGGTTAELTAELHGLDDHRLAEQLAEAERVGHRAARDVALLETLVAASARELARRIADGERSPDAIAPPAGVDRDEWTAFVRVALPLFAGRTSDCVLCGSDVAGRHGDRLGHLQAVLDDVRTVVGVEADRLVDEVRDALLKHEGSGTAVAREPGADLLVALEKRNASGLYSAADDVDAALTRARAQREDARTAWQQCRQVLQEAETRRADLRARLAAARRAETLAARPEETAQLAAHLAGRQRLAAAARVAGLKQRVNTALRTMTSALLESTYGSALTARLHMFRVPHVELLTARHTARGRGGRAQRRHAVHGTPTDTLFSEGEQRSLALADFAAELDTRPTTQHPVVLDDPVSSLDYRRIDTVVDHVRALLEEGRQVVVLTHSLWLAARLMKIAKERKGGGGPDRAWMLERSPERLGVVAPLRGGVLGGVDGYAERIDAAIADASADPDPARRDSHVRHGLSLLRSWCEALVEQRVLGNVVTRLDMQVRPAKLRGIDPEQIRRGQDVSRIYDRLHERIDAHAQPGELLHRGPTLDELVRFWVDARTAAGLTSRGP